jgi:small-conductance mechanosensitive channel
MENEGGTLNELEVTENQGGTVTDPNTGKTIPIERFNEVYGKAKEYERNLGQYNSFGKPEELKTKLEKLAAWEKAVDEQRKTASLTPTEQDAAKRQLQIQKELFTAMPSLKLLDKIEAMEKKLGEYEGHTAEAKAEVVLKDHSTKFSKILSADKIDLKFQPKIEDYILSQMDDEQKRQFVQGDFSIAETIYANERKEGLISLTRMKSSPPAPAVRNSAGGTPPKGQEKKAMTMKEAENEAWNRMKGEE